MDPEALGRKGLYDEALAAAEAAVRDSAAGPARAEALASLGRVCALVGDYSRAVRSDEEALAIRPDLAVLNHLALVLRVLGDHQGALRRYELALAIRRTPESLIHVGSVRTLLGQYSTALEAHEEALRGSPPPAERATALAGMGTARSARGEFAQALRDFASASEIRRGLRDRGGEAAILGAMGHVHLEQGDYDPARSRLEAALGIVQVVGGPWTQAYARIRIARLLAETARPDEAEEEFRAGIAGCRTLESPVLLAEALRFRARVRLANGDPKGRFDADEALQHAVSPYDRGEALSTLGRFEGKRSRIEEAKELVSGRENLRAWLIVMEDDAAMRLESGDAIGACAVAEEAAAVAADRGAVPAERRLRALEKLE